MAVTDFVVAIELASTKITGIACKRNADGSIYILAKKEEYSADSIRKGAIYNLDKTTQVLNNIIQGLEDDLHASIKKIYVGISGKSLRSFVNNEKREFNEETKISQALIDSIMQSNEKFPLMDMELLHVEPQEYKIGNNLLTEPVGINTKLIEGSFVNVVARPSLKENIIQCFRHTGCEIAGLLISPIEAANTTLTENEKRSGCALVDIGADTTTVSVYKNNILRHLAVIPMGGNNITQDIRSLQLEEKDAEALKLKFASAYTPESEDPDYVDKMYNLNDNVNIQVIKLENIVESRIYEIISNIWNQITIAGYADKLMAGVIITGGTANMANMDAAFKRITKIEKVRIAKESLIQTSGIELKKDATNNTIIGLLAASKENCCRIDPKIGHTIDFIDTEVKAEKEQEETIEIAITAENEAETENVEVNAPTEETLNAAENLVGEIENIQSEAQPEQEETPKGEETPAEVTANIPGTTSAEAEKETEQALTEEEKKAEEFRLRNECQTHISKVSEAIVSRRYDEALAEIEYARQYNLENKKAELDSYEKEVRRLIDEARKVDEFKRKKEKEEAERRRRQKDECRRLVDEIHELVDNKDLKEAREKIKEAMALNVSDYQDELNELFNQAKEPPKKKNWFTSAWNRIVKEADDMMKDN